MKQHSESPLIRRLVETGKLEYLLRGVGVFLKDYSTGIGFSNTFWKDCGYGEKELVEERWTELLHPEDKKRVTAALNRLRSGEGDAYAGEYRIRDDKDRYHWVRHKAIVLERTPEGVPSLYMGTDIDITDLMERLEAEKNDLDEMERRYLEAETLRLAGTVVTAGINPGQAIERILAQSERVVPADAILLWAVTEEGLECVGSRGTELLTPISEAHMPRNYAWVLEERRPRRNFGRSNSRGDSVYKDSLYVPVAARGRVLGILEFLAKDPHGLGHRAEGPAAVFADFAAVALENALEFRELDREAGMDWLTGLPTRRRFDFHAQALLQDPQGMLECCVLMMDLDNFKVVNDTFGHAAGDIALADTARVCREILRVTDLICRYGGEEISILLPAADSRAGKTVAERIRAGVEALRFSEYPDMRLTISIGVCSGRSGKRNLSDLLEEADKALYTAKAEGRNRVVLTKLKSSKAEL